jgi:hypothetical protein
MNREQRIAYLSKLSSSEKKPSRSKEIWYKISRQTLPVHEIDLQYLIYNAYNGRIASFVKSYERQTGKKLDATDPGDVKIIEEFLWNSNTPSNKETKKSLKDKRQLEYGIVTKDGVIIDGNRRAFLIKQIAAERAEQPAYFLAVILDERLDENPKEIMRLETTYQMGEDAKVDYNAIEKYLRCKDLMSEGFTSEEIGKMMGENPPKIEEYVSIMTLMDDYLEKLGYSGIYTRLDRTEGAFVDLNGYLKKYQGKNSGMASWHYKPTDVEDLKLIYYDYIQFMYNKTKGKRKDEDEGGVFGSEDSKDYRTIGKPSKKESLFCADEKIWAKFRDNHFQKLDPIREKFIEGGFTIDALKKDSEGMDLNTLLKRRDELWAEKVGPALKENLGTAKYELQNFNNQNEPEILLRRALSTLESIDTEPKSFYESPEVEQLVSVISKLTWDLKQLIKQKRKGQ